MIREDVADYRRDIVVPTLRLLGLHSQAAENLVVGTAIVESGLVAIRQHGPGPALGHFQIEPDTWADLHETWLRYHRDVEARLDSLLIAGGPPALHQLQGNLYYACAVCRLIYYRRPEPLPAADDIERLAAYWKARYNTHAGDGDPAKWVARYRRFAL